MGRQGITNETALQCLRSGHSHEDLDQVFGQLAKHLVRKGSSAMEPLDFVALIERWLTDVLVRPFEVKRYAILLDQVRDWSLGFVLRSW